jgi:hypothetical protein
VAQPFFSEDCAHSVRITASRRYSTNSAPPNFAVRIRWRRRISSFFASECYTRGHKLLAISVTAIPVRSSLGSCWRIYGLAAPELDAGISSTACAVIAALLVAAE